jgi:hypothetical protein
MTIDPIHPTHPPWIQHHKPRSLRPSVGSASFINTPPFERMDVFFIKMDQGPIISQHVEFYDEILPYKCMQGFIDRI